VRWNQAAAVAAIVAACVASPAIAKADPPAPAPPPAPKTSIDADGTYAVGTDIAPGTYSSAGPVGDGACYWKRVKGDDLVDNAFSKQPQIVQIDPADTGFKTSGCQPWQLVACPPQCPPTQGSPLGVLGDLTKFLAPRLGTTGPPAGG
jgi:hypothetical protein